MPANRIKLSVVLLSLTMISCSRTARVGDFDLVAASVTFVPNPVHVGEEIGFSAAIRNDGADTVPARTYHVDLYLDGQRITFDYAAGSLMPGCTSTYSRAPCYPHWQPARAGRYHYRLVVDERDTVTECNERNNVVEGDLEVLPP